MKFICLDSAIPTRRRRFSRADRKVRLHHMVGGVDRFCLTPMYDSPLRDGGYDVLILSLHGSPFLYYGDEIGMGDNVYLGRDSAIADAMVGGPQRRIFPGRFRAFV